MNPDEQLVRMANQIARAFAAYPEPEAVAATAKHLAEFWDPSMRARLSQLAAHAGLSPIVIKGIGHPPDRGDGPPV